MTEAERQQVTALGKLLAAERRDGCANRVASDGLMTYLKQWSATAVSQLVSLPSNVLSVGWLVTIV